ncbi:MAG: arsenate reductase (glutaredoxin) [Flavobacteriales bacterium]|nr:arsenate reductase (glutaredoxin) [Flavobacteriales bacterium]
MLTIWHNNRCGKSRTALQILEEKGIPFEVKKYLETPPSEKEIKEVLKKTGLKAHDIIRTGEAVYKENFKGKNLSEAEWIKVMTTHPILIERPIVINGEKAVVARPPEKVLEIL